MSVELGSTHAPAPRDILLIRCVAHLLLRLDIPYFDLSTLRLAMIKVQMTKPDYFIFDLGRGRSHMCRVVATLSAPRSSCM